MIFKSLSYTTMIVNSRFDLWMKTHKLIMLFLYHLEDTHLVDYTTFDLIVLVFIKIFLILYVYISLGFDLYALSIFIYMSLSSESYKYDVTTSISHIFKFCCDCGTY